MLVRACFGQLSFWSAAPNANTSEPGRPASTPRPRYVRAPGPGPREPLEAGRTGRRIRRWPGPMQDPAKKNWNHFSSILMMISETAAAGLLRVGAKAGVEAHPRAGGECLRQLVGFIFVWIQRFYRHHQAETNGYLWFGGLPQGRGSGACAGKRKNRAGSTQQKKAPEMIFFAVASRAFCQTKALPYVPPFSARRSPSASVVVSGGSANKQMPRLLRATSLLPNPHSLPARASV